MSAKLTLRRRVRRTGIVFYLLGIGVTAVLPYSRTTVIATFAGVLIGLGSGYIWPLERELRGVRGERGNLNG